MTYKVYPNSMTALPSSQIGSKVVIITRTKNRPILLARAFASVLSQTHQDWHLCLVNDGGDPGQVNELVDMYSAAFGGRITVKHQAVSLGMEAASNAALDGASGDFIVVHDDDDAWKPSFLERTVAYLNAPENMRMAAVATSCIAVYERILENGTVELNRRLWCEAKDVYDFKDMLTLNSFPPICFLIRKTAVDHLNGFNSELPVLGDWEFNLRLLLLGNIGGISDSLAYYYHRPVEDGIYGNSIIASESRHRYYHKLYIDSLLRDYLTKEPGFVGVLNILMTQSKEVERNLQNQINMLHSNIHMLQSNVSMLDNTLLPTIHALNQMLRPARWLWRGALPARRLVARLRGRI